MTRKLPFFAATATAVAVVVAQSYALALPIDRGAYSTLRNDSSFLPETVQYLPRSGYTFPRAGGAIVDWCVTFAHDCGWGGAHQFCQSKGFDRALSWDIFHPGHTYVMGSDRYCDGDFCKGFRFIRCG